MVNHHSADPGRAPRRGPSPGQHGGHPPLTPAQHGLWYLDRLHPGTPAYNVPLAIRLTGPLDVPALRGALGRTVARHSALRTVFRTQADEPYQHVLPVAGLGPKLPVTDLTHLPGDARERRAESLRQEWARQPFDLASGPLLRAGLIRLGAQDHVLSLVLHHIVCDGQSLRLLFGEFGDAYGGVPLEDAPSVQFADWAHWSRDRPEEPSVLDWWREHLRDVPSTPLFPRVVTHDVSGAARTTVGALPSGTMTSVRSYAVSARTTPFVIMLSAYAALLGHLTGARVVLVGVPASRRPVPQVQSTVGMFVDTLVVKADLSGDPPFGELVSRVRSSLLAALDHTTSFGALVNGLRVPRTGDRAPLVQATFGFDDAPLVEPRFPGLVTHLLPTPLLPAKFDLDMMVAPAAGGRGHEIAVAHSAGLPLPPLDADRLPDVYAGVLGGARTPGARLSDLLPARHGATAPSRPAPPRVPFVPVHVHVSRQARSGPDRPAVRQDGTTLTYAGLDARAEAVAERLHRAGVRPGDVVGVHLPRGVDAVTALLAVLKAGAAYLPLALTCSPGHLARQTLHCGVRVIVTDTRDAPRAAGTGAVVVCLDEEWAEASRPAGECREGSRRRPVRVRPDDLAYVLYTSGSTGEPKAVAVPHRALANHAHSMRELLCLTPRDGVLHFAQLSFDVAAEEIFPTLLAGACVVIGPEPPAPAQATSLLSREGVTVANLPSGYWQRWFSALSPDLSPTRPFPLPSLRLMVVGSERVDAASVAAWTRQTGVPLLNAYGLTETTITSLTHLVPDGFAGAVVPVGTPLDGVGVYVLDGCMNPAGAGVEGELYVGGAGLAHGYLGRPRLTAERFVPDAWSGVPGARMYRTGDRARLRADGAVEVLGRLDDQLKVNGHRVEPAEVEAALSTHPAVAQAAVAVRQAQDGTPLLVGYVVRRGSSPDVPGDLRAHLSARLPFHLVPTALVALRELPVTSTGKTDRAALPRPAMPAHHHDGTPPTTGWQRGLAEIWQRVLGVEDIGVHDNFFDAGGTSFSLVTVHARIVDLVREDIPLVVLYEHPTIASLAETLSRRTGGRPAPLPDGHASAESDQRIRTGLHRLNRMRRGRP